MKKLIYTFLFLSVLTSCFKKEIAINKPESSATVTQIEMGASYANQLYYDLETNSILRQNDREVWDLAFEAGDQGFHILLNEARMMAAALTSETDLSAVNSTSGLTFHYDLQSGNLDSTAIGDWTTTNSVYVINLGTNLSGQALGYMKVKFTAVTTSGYEMEFASLSSSTIQTYSIEKSATAGFTYFSFSDGGSILDIEPDKTEWDLLFTSYCHIFDDETPYSVVGVLSNRNGVEVQEVTSGFDSFNYADIDESLFETRINVIGYDWKVYDFDNGLYTVDATRTFIVKTYNDRYFKLRFVDFYDETGVKGAPKFEVQELIP